MLVKAREMLEELPSYSCLECPPRKCMLRAWAPQWKALKCSFVWNVMREYVCLECDAIPVVCSLEITQRHGPVPFGTALVDMRTDCGALVKPCDGFDRFRLPAGMCW
jgi:DNA-directed RNA polymerase subunit RPC12/RpoP